MKIRYCYVTSILLLAAFLTACGPSQADLDATATQHYGPYYATLTAMAPTASEAPTTTPTLPPEPSSTPEPSATHEPSATATLAEIRGIDVPLEFNGKSLILIAAKTQSQLDLMDKAEGGQWVQLEGIYLFMKDDRVEIPDDTDRIVNIDDTSSTMLVIDAKVEGADFSPMDSDQNRQLFNGELVCNDQTYGMMMLAADFADGKYLDSIFVYYIPKTIQASDCIFIPIPSEEIPLRSYFQ
jgi:hypothetical protein